MVVPTLTQIVPVRVQALDQRDLFLSPPPLYLFFSVDCSSDIVEALPIDQSALAKLIRESFQDLFFVLPGALGEVAGNSRVENARSAGQDVNVINVFTHFEA